MYSCMFEAMVASGIALQLLMQYPLASIVEARVDSVLWQEDDRVALVEKAYYYSLTKKR